MDPGSVERIRARAVRRFVALGSAVVALRTRHCAECTDGILLPIVACVRF
jgi:hypothetical protein